MIGNMAEHLAVVAGKMLHDKYILPGKLPVCRESSSMSAVACLAPTELRMESSPSPQDGRPLPHLENAMAKKARRPCGCLLNLSAKRVKLSWWERLSLRGDQHQAEPRSRCFIFWRIFLTLAAPMSPPQFSLPWPYKK